MIKIAAFTDGRPGHEKQTRAVIEALALREQTDVEWISVKHHSLIADFFGHLLFLLPFRHPQKPQMKDVDLFIGTGRRTHLPLLQGRGGGKGYAVCCMAPSKLLRRSFDLCLVPRHDGLAEADNIFLTIGPPAVSLENRERKKENGLILVGGINNRSHHWDTAWLCEKIEMIIKREKERNWTISSSPRTPEETVHALDKLATGYHNCSFISFHDTPRGWVEKMYGQSAMVWVTADSMSMVFEALSSGCEVGLLPVKWKKQDLKFRRCESQLIEEKAVISFEDYEKGVSSTTTRKRLREAQRCADEILRRWSA